MALVKVIASNLFAGADFKRLEVGASIEVSKETADRWIKAGLATLIDDKKFEVATPSHSSVEAEQDGRSRKKREME
jgi:hypothetical protein